MGLGELRARGEMDLDTGALLVAGIVGALALGAGLTWSAVRTIRIRGVLPPERYRGPAVIVLLAMVLLIGTIVIAPFASDAAALIDGDGAVSLPGAVVILVSTPVALLTVGWLFVARPNALAGLPSFPGRNAGGAAASGFGWGVLAWLGSTLLLAAVAWLLTAIGQPPDAGTAELAIARLPAWIVVPTIVIAAPVAEEIFFRGIIFNAWLREGGRRYAYIGSAALFAVIHLSLVSLLPIFALGLALAWVYERSGHNLLAPIAMHATVNGISVGLSLLLQAIDVPVPV